LVNWDPVLLTALSDLEVQSEEEEGHLWHLRYPLEDGSAHVVVATTRPETMLGDTAVAVNPDDERYKHLVGKRLRLPLAERPIPVIADAYVDASFGSGCVKITPAHDFNDYEIGLRHGLEQINILTPRAALNDNVPARDRGAGSGGPGREDREAQADGAPRRPQRRGVGALPHRPVVRQNRAARRP